MTSNGLDAVIGLQTFADMKAAQSEAIARYASTHPETKARTRFVIAEQEAGIAIKKAFGGGAYEVAAFHALIGSTPPPVKAMQFPSFELSDILQAVTEALDLHVPVERTLAPILARPKRLELNDG